MCEPTTVLTALSVAGTAFGAVSQYREGQRQIDAAEQQAKFQAEEDAAQRDQQIGERVRAARRERARMRTAAGEAGVQGQSFEAQLQDNLGNLNQDLAVAQKQGFFNSRAIKSNLDSATAGARSFSPLAAGLQIADAGYSGFQRGLSIKRGRAAASGKT